MKVVIVTTFRIFISNIRKGFFKKRKALIFFTNLYAKKNYFIFNKFVYLFVLVF